MNDKETRRLQMFARVDGFGDQHSGDFAANSVGRQLFTNLKNVLAELDTHAGAEASGHGSARQGTESRAQAREALRDDLEAIYRTARAIEDEVPGLAGKLIAPPPFNDQLMLNTARAYVSDVQTFKANFIAHEMPADFLEDLAADIAAFETAVNSQSSGVGDHVAARAAIDSAMDRGMELVRKINAVIRNKYADRSDVLAEWTSASHTERTPKRRTAPATTPTPPTP